MQIPPPLVEEVHAHLKEMLDSGTICPSQSVWCNAVVLVWKKDGGLTFLYKLLPPQHPHKERLLPTAYDPGSTREASGCWSSSMVRTSSRVMFVPELLTNSPRYTCKEHMALGRRVWSWHPAQWYIVKSQYQLWYVMASLVSSSLKTCLLGYVMPSHVSAVNVELPRGSWI